MARRPRTPDAEVARRGLSRRGLLTGGAAALGGGVLAGALASGAGGAMEGHDHGSNGTAPPLRALTREQAELVSAMADRVFPGDEHSPSATEVGVVAYLDGQLAGGFGAGERFYASGPFHEPDDSGHGYQLPLTPRELYRRVLPRIDAYAQDEHGARFAELEPAQQDEVMEALEADEVDLGLADGGHGFRSAQFFGIFLQNVREGLFADPMYGGNRNAAGWRWIRYPGDPMAYGDVYYAMFDSWDVSWDVEPSGLAEHHR